MFIYHYIIIINCYILPLSFAQIKEKWQIICNILSNNRNIVILINKTLYVIWINKSSSAILIFKKNRNIFFITICFIRLQDWDY